MIRILLVVIILAVASLAARPRRGDVAGALRGWPWLAAGLALQLLWVRLFSSAASVSSVLPGLARWAPCLALGLALRFVWLNRRYRGLWVLAAGIGLNLLVMAVNGGLMPLAPASLHALGGAPTPVGTALAFSKDALLGNGAIRLALLDDRLVSRVAGLRIAWSLGDLLIVAGCLVTVGEDIWRGMRVVLPSQDHVDQRPRSLRVAHRPDIARRHGRDRAQGAIATRVRASHEAPVAAHPLCDKGARAGSGWTGPDGPGVVRRQRGDGAERGAATVPEEG